MSDKITLVLSIGEFFTVRAALERWEITLNGYEKTELTEQQMKDVRKFKSETASVLKAIAAARSRYLQGASS